MAKVHNFKYATAAESAKPGYLARKFARIRQEQAEQAEKVTASQAEQAEKVRKIKPGAA